MGRGPHITKKEQMKLVSIRLQDQDLDAIDLTAKLKDMSKSEAHRFLIQYGTYYFTRDIAAEEES